MRNGLSRVAPAVIVTDGVRCIAYDGELYAARLAEASVAMTAMRLLGTIHNFIVIDDLQRSGATVSALRDALRTALHE
jgi:acetyl esterase